VRRGLMVIIATGQHPDRDQTTMRNVPEERRPSPTSGSRVDDVISLDEQVPDFKRHGLRIPTKFRYRGSSRCLGHCVDSLDKRRGTADGGRSDGFVTHICKVLLPLISLIVNFYQNRRPLLHCHLHLTVRVAPPPPNRLDLPFAVLQPIYRFILRHLYNIVFSTNIFTLMLHNICHIPPM
jgi:hypothetical protein